MRVVPDQLAFSEAQSGAAGVPVGAGAHWRLLRNIADAGK